MLIAKAIYDNEGETTEELSFDREDILAVLELDYNGMEGWWLCSLRGKTGIAPANRLLVLHKIDVKSSSAAVKGPRFPSEVLRTMDYDFPKPDVPRKIGGSIDNLLTIVESDSYRGVGGGLVSRSGGSKPSGKRETETSLAKKRGVSIGNLLDSSTIAEYAVPASMSPNDYEVPRKNAYGKKWGNSPDESSSGKGMMSSTKNSHRPKKTSDQMCETSKRHIDLVPRNLLLPELKLWDRDSCLADYDTPSSGHRTVSSEDKGARSPASKCQLGQQPVRRSAETQSKSSNKAQKCEIVDPGLLSSLSEVRNAVLQITSYADKWRTCTNPSMKLSIVKQVCVAVWKKLQALILEFSKCLAKFKGRGLSPLDDRLGAIKVVTAELERILNYISSCHPNDIHQDGIDYVSELVRIATEIESHLDYCSSFFNSDLGDLLTCPKKTSKHFGYNLRVSSSDETPSEAEKRQIAVRRAPALPPPRVDVAVKTSETCEDDFSISTVRYNSKTPTFGRSFSYDKLSSDYDIPKSSSVELGSTPMHGLEKKSAVLRSGGTRSADVGHTKRNAVVVEKSSEAFNILQRRNPHSQMASSKLITERTKTEQSGKTGNLDMSNSSEYDYPTATNGGTPEPVAHILISRDFSRDLEEPITVYDKRMLVFYGERLNAELSQLKISCQAVSCRSAETSDGLKSLSAQIQTLVISAHKLVFVADALVKKLSGAALRKQLQRQAMEIIDRTKSIALLAKSSLAFRTSSNRQQLSEDNDKLLAAALTFQNIVIKASK